MSRFGEARAQVATDYATEAHDYRDLWAPVLNRVAIELLDELPAGDRVLDVGSGVGTLLPCLRDRLRAERVVGVDATLEMLALADRSFDLVVGDATSLPVSEGAFDVVVAAFCLFHLPEPGPALSEAARVLRRGGSVGVITWENDSGCPAYEIWIEELDRHCAAPHRSTAWHELVDSPEKVGALLDEAGFGEIEPWTRPWRDEPTPEEFLERRLRLGSSRRRFESLDEGARAACVEAARGRMKDLGREGFASDWRFVLATARAMDAGPG